MGISEDWDATTTVVVKGGAFSVSFQGNIRHKCGDFLITVEEFHRALETFKNKHEEGISEFDPETRTITLHWSANIDDEMATHLCNGSLVQRGGEEIYSTWGGDGVARKHRLPPAKDVSVSVLDPWPYRPIEVGRIVRVSGVGEEYDGYFRVTGIRPVATEGSLAKDSQDLIEFTAERVSPGTPRDPDSPNDPDFPDMMNEGDQ